MSAIETLREAQDLERSANEALARAKEIRSSARAAMAEHITKLIDESGYTPEELGYQRIAKRESKVEAKYRDPDNHENTWAGRGKRPIWLAQKLGEGRSLEEFLIK